jgi:tRNA G18 (ribose-2'-O)-methylase SpoU
MPRKPEHDPELVKHGDRRNVVDKYRYWSIAAINEDMRMHAFPYHVAIENYQHDFNIGTIVRNANAFNAAGVHIIGKHKWNRRGAMVTEKYLQLYYHETVQQFVDWSREAELQIIGIDNIEQSTALSVSQLPEHAVLVFGQEGPGLSEEMITHCAGILAIEQFGSTRSVNVGVASGIILYEWVRRYILLTEG